jgi:hypothetical protein
MTINISKNKRIIIEMYWDKGNDWERWFSVTTAFSRKVDHAGFDFFMDIAKFYFRFSINDKRFWDYEKDNWFDPSEHEHTKFKYDWF